MKQFAFLLAISAALALTGAAVAAPAGPSHRPPFHAPGFAHHHPGGPHGHHHRHHGGGNGFGWPLFAPPPMVESREFVTHDFVYPGAFRPRLPRVTVLTDKPVVFRQPPHIIELGHRKHRQPIFVVRRGVMSEE
ncbi:hypothetical protein CCR94_20360 [Rhodoblastus sphagnicola]|uniref:Uncharacterized protein n=1 Tax=Rhodoblastus sphagnicola TaxID=333368 RepID=A0A2S6MXV4_9HYPH|nr:hypothetical protein [Rhodoblastus sphagnicola]MBB4196643.1 hypothetical protein [Rhodoblastus sphagnicola]PPQ27192.1 hypothetical protein CCR94_20360 [Rhodoblastus sphagnicola]